MKSSPENDSEKCDWYVQFYNDAGYTSGRPDHLYDKTEKEANDWARAQLDDWSKDHFSVKKV